MTRTRLLALARPHRAALLLLAGLTLAESLAFLALPALLGAFAGRALDGSGATLVPILALIALAMIGAAAFRVGVNWLAARTGAGLLAALRRAVHDHLQRLPLAFHHRHRQGDLLSLSTWDVADLRDLLTQTLVSLPAQLVTAAGAILLMARIDPALAVLVPLLVPLFFLAMRGIGRRLRCLGRHHRDTDSALLAAAAEDLAMLPAIKAFATEDHADRRHARLAEEARAAMARLMVAQGAIAPLASLVAGLAAVALLALLGERLQSGVMTGGETVSFLLYAALLTRPVAGLSVVYGAVQASRGTLERLSAVLDEPPEPGHDAPLRLPRARGAIAWEDVSFRYEGREPALRGVSLAVAPGETVALTGPNGAGKTTLASLLLRFADPASGVVRLDGHDLRDIRLGDLRRQIGYVPQRPLLFDGTVADNIRLGREATDAQLEAAARLAQAHDFIEGLPQGYDTLLGENGLRLSGGQGQRIALARALLGDPPVLILDEATAMIDLDAEGAFVAAAATGLRGRTVILITHRPATLALADRVVELREGRIQAIRAAA